MRPSLLDLLACPGCAGELAFGPAERAERNGHIMTGELACRGCGSRYPIERGVPRLLPPTVDRAAVETSARFAAEWTRFRHLGSYDETWFRNWLQPLGPDDLRGRTVLEGGCGKGRHTIIAARWGAARVVALDLGAAAYVAFEHTRDHPNAHVIRGDLLNPPLKRAAFDVAFSIGVLHHLQNPRAGFDALRTRVKPGGRIAVWVYGYESNEWIVRYVNPVRDAFTARLSPRALFWLSLLPAGALAAAVRLYRIGPLAERLPYRDYLALLATVPLREVHSIVFDQLVTPIAHYLPEHEVRSWFAQDGLEEVRIAWHNKNSWRGHARVAS